MYIFLVSKQTCSLLSVVCFPPKLIMTIMSLSSIFEDQLSVLPDLLHLQMFLFVYLERQWSAPKDWSLAFLLSNAPRQCLTITLPSLSGKSHRISRVHYLEQEVKMHTTRLKTSSFQGPTLSVHYIPVVTLNGYTISTGFILSRPD